MRSACLLGMVAVVTTGAVWAGDVMYKGRTVVVGDQEGGPIERVEGTRYVVPGSPDALLTKAQGCLAGLDGVSDVAADPAQGRLEAQLLSGFRASFANQTLRSRLRLEVGEDSFQLTDSGLELARSEEEGFRPLLQSGMPWEKALDALIKHEDALVDCMYRR